MGAYQSQQGWQQQMAQRNMQQMQGMGQRQQGWPQQMQGAAAGTGQDYDAIRAQAAAYYAYMDQRGQSAAAYAQAQAAQQAAVAQGGYQNPSAGAANFSNYGTAAAATYAA